MEKKFYPVIFKEYHFTKDQMDDFFRHLWMIENFVNSGGYKAETDNEKENDMYIFLLEISVTFNDYYYAPAIMGIEKVVPSRLGEWEV